MNNRDPFGIRPGCSSAFTSLRSLQTTRDRPIQAGQQVVETGRQALEQATASMSSYAPPHVTSDGPSQRHAPGGSTHAHAHGNGGSITEKVGDFFSADRHNSLPMYKDKPYGYPASRGAKWRWQWRSVAGALATIAVLSWWFNILSPMAWLGLGTDRPARSPGSLFWDGMDEIVGWERRAEIVRETFQISWKGYEDYAWGYDEYSPVSKSKKKMTPDGMGWIIVDALDTMMLMNLTSELAHARQWIHQSLHYDQNHDVNTFETTIRMLGGLLSAHYLSTQINGPYSPVNDGFSEDLYLETAMDLADRLLGAYNSESGVPFASINLQTRVGIPSHSDGGASSMSEATSLQLEMKYLSKLTGEAHYWSQAERVMKVVDDQHPPDGLAPLFISAQTGQFRGNQIRLGSRVDSFYEYLIKQYLQTSHQEPVYQAMWNESLAGIKKHLLTYSAPSNFTVLAERPSGLDRDLSPKMDHLTCFLPGTIALATTDGLSLAQARKDGSWGPAQEEDMRLAEELMKTCWGMYRTTPTGLAAEITHFNIHSPPIMYSSFPQLAKPPSRSEDEDWGVADQAFSKSPGGNDFVVHPSAAHNMQRPETVESLFYMWRITGDVKYREWGWKMFESFVKWTQVDDKQGFSSLADVMTVPPPMRDNMESFWLVSLSVSESRSLVADRPCAAGRNTQVFLPSLLAQRHPPP